MITTYILLLFATGYHLLFDYHRKSTNKIVHWLSALLAVASSLVMGYINQLLTGVPFWQFGIYSLCIHLSLFDPLWNWVNNKAWNYHGTISNPQRAWTDRIWTQVPGAGEILFRIIFLILGYEVYYNLDLILN